MTSWADRELLRLLRWHLDHDPDAGRGIDWLGQYALLVRLEGLGVVPDGEGGAWLTDDQGEADPLPVGE